MKISYVCAAALALVSTSAFAQTAITTLDGSQGVAAPAGELGASSSVTITSNNALSSNGSLELKGDRTRVLNGNNYAPTASFGLLSSIVSLTGDYMVLNGGSTGTQSPAFRVYVQDGTQRSELIWEAAYNGGYTLGTADSVEASDIFWQNIAGVGATPGSTFGYTMHTLADWVASYSSAAYISAFGVGDGSGAGTGFDALADNVTLTTTAGTVSYDFQAAAAAVPEPASWAMFIGGFGLVGAAMRRKKIGVSFA